MVAVILAIVTGMSLPSLRAANSESRRAVMERLAVNMSSTADLFFLKCQTTMAAHGTQDCDNLDIGTVVIRGTRHYPSATTHGIALMAGIADLNGNSSQFALREITANGVKGLSVSLQGAEKESCDLQYLEAADEGKRPSITLNPSTCH